MDKLETAKQAAVGKAFQNWNVLPMTDVLSQVFDAGVAYQGEWTAVEEKEALKLCECRHAFHLYECKGKTFDHDDGGLYQCTCKHYSPVEVNT